MIFYGWIIVAVAFLTWGISTGPRQAFPIFLLALMEEFGWSRALTAGAFSVHMTLYALGGWALGILMDRIGPRRVIIYGTSAWALILVSCGQIQSLWQLYVLFGVLGGVATSGLAYVPNNALLSSWFIRYRGLATGLSQSGISLGAAVFGPLSQIAIAGLGWRRTYLAFGILVAVTALPLVALFLRDDPRDMGLYPDGIPPAASPPGGSPVEAVPGLSLPPGYWTLFSGNILRGITYNGILVHQVAYLVDVGFGKMTAASLFSATALMAVLGGFVSGGVSDRLGRHRTYGAMAALYVIGILCLLLVHDRSQLVLVYAFVLATGIATGGSGPVFAALLTDRLHGPRFGFLIGLQNIAFGGGAAIGPFLAGALFDLFGNYTAAFLLLAASIGVSSAIIYFQGGRRPRRRR